MACPFGLVGLVNDSRYAHPTLTACANSAARHLDRQPCRGHPARRSAEGSQDGPARYPDMEAFE